MYTSGGDELRVFQTRGKVNGIAFARRRDCLAQRAVGIASAVVCVVDFRHCLRRRLRKQRSEKTNHCAEIKNTTQA